MVLIDKLHNSSRKKSRHELFIMFLKTYLSSNERNNFSLLKVKINKNVIMRELIYNDILLTIVEKTVFNFPKGKLQT